MSGPIGIFDSGLGGLSVLTHARRHFPGQDFVYFADQGHAPYGDRSSVEVHDLTVAAVDRLLEHQAKAIVIACNTASDSALESMRTRYPQTPFVGIEPAVKPAVAASRSGIVGVLATTRTVRGSRLRSLIREHAGPATVLTQACPGLVDLIEDGLGDTDHTRDLIATYLRPLISAGADTIALGCTHYSFVADHISAEAGPTVAIIDPADAVARQIGRVVDVDATGGTVRYETSGDSVRTRRQLQEMFGVNEPVYSAP